MNDPISIVGLYFALIGFLSGIFFTRLDSWYSEVRAKHAVLSSNLHTNDPQVKRIAPLEDPFNSLQSSAPFSGFITIGAFITFLAVLSLFLPVSSSSFNIVLFLYVPVFLTVLFYLIGGGMLLISGTELVSQALTIIYKINIGDVIPPRAEFDRDATLLVALKKWLRSLTTKLKLQKNKQESAPFNKPLIDTR